MGGQYTYFKNTVEFNLTREVPRFEGLKKDFRLGSLDAIGLYDSRNSNFTTNRGIYSQAKADFYAPVFGSDYEFQKYAIYGLGWRPTSLSSSACGWTRG